MASSSNQSFAMTGSIIETTAVLDEMLRPEGYDKYTIGDIATSMFTTNEKIRIHDDSSIHLVAIKKLLLYAIPVITPRNGTTGIMLSSQVYTPAIQLRNDKIKTLGLAIGDKFRLLGFAFPKQLINHLAYSIFPQKYEQQLPSNIDVQQLNIEYIHGISPKHTAIGTLYIIDPKEYENIHLFNQINKILANKLLEDITVALATKNTLNVMEFPELARIEPFNTNTFIDNLNKIMDRRIDNTFSMSLYEMLNMTSNWLIYDLIKLFGYESSETADQLRYLSYVKDQKSKVRINVRDTEYRKLLLTRAEKICRDTYPYFFDYTDHRSIFIKFNRFDMNKLPPKERNEIEILLKKELDAQDALLSNKCEHLKHIKSMNITLTSETYKEIEPYIDFQSLDNNTGMYKCKLCGYPLLCVHTVELYDAISAISESTDGSDQIYWARQKIINKFKLINQKQSNSDDTEVIFTYYCKYCSGELGKSDDIIQASIKTIEESTSVNEQSPYEKIIYMNVMSTILQNMNTDAISINPKTIVNAIFSEIKDEIVWITQRSSYNDDNNIELLIRYLTQVYTLVSLISLNINKIKSPKSVMNTNGGNSLKEELVSAFNIIKNIPSYKQISITDEKIKSSLIEAFKFVNRAFSSETIILKSVSASDKLIMDINESPISHYAKFIHDRFEKSMIDTLDVVGVNIDKLFPKKKQVDKIKTHALYMNIYEPKINPKNDVEKFIVDAYRSIVELVKIQPINDMYLSTITPPLSEFVAKFQTDRSKFLKMLRTTPIRNIPAINTREYDFNLKILQLAYCDIEPVQPHRWIITKHDDKIDYKCKYCNIQINKVSISNNDKINEMLRDKRIKEAFFELYTLSCPVKDAHAFTDGICVKCGITKDKIINMDTEYYKKFYKPYMQHRQDITNSIISATKKIIESSTPLVRKESTNVVEKVDKLKLESVASNLNKLYNIQMLDKLGIFGDQPRSLNAIQSYVRVLYSYYIFAKNISNKISAYYDIDFFKLSKELLLTGPKHTKLPDLPPYPNSENADKLLFDLLSIILNMVSSGNGVIKDIIGYILNKIVAQDSRFGEFNFAKLKALPMSDDIDLSAISDSIDQTPDDEEVDMFYGYDMDNDDFDDNINGALD